MKKPIFTGVCTAMVTPYKSYGIDYHKFGELIDFQAENGTTAILISGTTGENATQSFDEHCRLLEFSALHNNGRMKLIAGIGSNCTETALQYGRVAELCGYDGVLMVTPYYNKTTQRGLIEHFTYVADRISLPMILYNVPSRTGIGIALDTYMELSKHPNINGVKEASGDYSLFSKIKSVCGDDFNVWSGNDDQTVGMMALGALGVISVASNVIPAQMTELCRLCRQGDFKAAEAMHFEFASLFSALFLETNPIPVKTAMNMMGMDVGLLRLPLVEMATSNQEILRNCLLKIGLCP